MSTILAVIIVCLLVTVVTLQMLHLRAVRQPVPLELSIAPQIEDAIERLSMAARHYADVSAVVEMVRQLDADPDALELIKSYPETVRAAAWLHYINTLGADLQAAQTALSRAHKGIETGFLMTPEQFIGLRQKNVDNIRAKLDAAIAASGQTGLRSI